MIPMQVDCPPTGETQTSPVNQVQTVTSTLCSAPVFAAMITHGSVACLIVLQTVDVWTNLDT